jgi:hypothetical protein
MLQQLHNDYGTDSQGNRRNRNSHQHQQVVTYGDYSSSESATFEQIGEESEVASNHESVPPRLIQRSPSFVRVKEAPRENEEVKTQQQDEVEGGSRSASFTENQRQNGAEGGEQ